MRIFKITFIALILGVAAFGCSKSSSGSNSATLQGNWTFVSGGIAGYAVGLSTPIFDSTIKASAGDYVNFNSNGNVYSQISGVKDTSAYNLIGSTKVSLNYGGTLDTFAISTLTQNTCTLAYTSPTFDTTIAPFGTVGAYGIVTFNLSK